MLHPDVSAFIRRTSFFSQIRDMKEPVVARRTRQKEPRRDSTAALQLTCRCVVPAPPYSLRHRRTDSDKDAFADRETSHGHTLPGISFQNPRASSLAATTLGATGPSMSGAKGCIQKECSARTDLLTVGPATGRIAARETIAKLPLPSPPSKPLRPTGYYVIFCAPVRPSWEVQ